MVCAECRGAVRCACGCALCLWLWLVCRAACSRAGMPGRVRTEPATEMSDVSELCSRVYGLEITVLR